MGVHDGNDSGVRMVLYRKGDGSAPLVDWMDCLPPRARAKVLVRLERLVTRWHSIRQTDEVHFADGLNELRLRHGGVVYAVFYFRFGLGSVVLVGGVTDCVGKGRLLAIRTSSERKRRFEGAPREYRSEVGLGELRERFFTDPKAVAKLEEARVSATIAELALGLRQDAGMSQRQLAERVGTGASVICRVEREEYSGAPLGILMRVAAVMGKQVEVRVVTHCDGARPR
ncbi:MAG: hypothetical protein GY711_24600 [bacterium]|nr:hypothetical protein [bacterium]